jgi:hypothetical protein
MPLNPDLVDLGRGGDGHSTKPLQLPIQLGEPVLAHSNFLA